MSRGGQRHDGRPVWREGDAALLAEMLTAEAVWVASSVAGGIVTAVAACLAGRNLAAVRRLPDTGGRERRVVVPLGQMRAVDGVLLEQLVRLAGAAPVLVGTAAACEADELAAFLAAGAAAALWLEPEAGAGPMEMARFVWTCRAAAAPAIVVTGARTGVLSVLDAGATLAIVDGASYGVADAGVIAGQADLVAACRGQERGIGALFRADSERALAILAAVRRAAGEGDPRMAWPTAADAAQARRLEAASAGQGADAGTASGAEEKAGPAMSAPNRT